MRWIVSVAVCTHIYFIKDLHDYQYSYFWPICYIRLLSWVCLLCTQYQSTPIVGVLCNVPVVLLLCWYDWSDDVCVSRYYSLFINTSTVSSANSSRWFCALGERIRVSLSFIVTTTVYFFSNHWTFTTLLRPKLRQKGMTTLILSPLRN